MSLPQLIGLNCVICQIKLASVGEGNFCTRCGNPVHNACLAQGEVKWAEGKCADCGGDPTDPLAVEVLMERKVLEKGIKFQLKSGIALAPDEIIPVSKVCPSCGGTRYTTRRPKATVAFISDRVCIDCNTRYSPPTPTWAGIVFLLAGLLLIILGFGAILLDVIVIIMRRNHASALSMFFNGALGVMGLLAFIFGVKSLSNSKKK